jgi:hypothetical protein
MYTKVGLQYAISTSIQTGDSEWLADLIIRFIIRKK